MEILWPVAVKVRSTSCFNEKFCLRYGPCLDGNVYVWHRDTGLLLEVLSGHDDGSVNSVAWNPKNERMFASCADDNSIRIWEAPPREREINVSVDVPRHTDYSVSSYSTKGKGKTRQMDGDVEDPAGMGSSSSATLL